MSLLQEIERLENAIITLRREIIKGTYTECTLDERWEIANLYYRLNGELRELQLNGEARNWLISFLALPA